VHKGLRSHLTDCVPTVYLPDIQALWLNQKEGKMDCIAEM